MFVCAASCMVQSYYYGSYIFDTRKENIGDKVTIDDSRHAMFRAERLNSHPTTCNSCSVPPSNARRPASARLLAVEWDKIDDTTCRAAFASLSIFYHLVRRVSARQRVQYDACSVVCGQPLNGKAVSVASQ